MNYLVVMPNFTGNQTGFYFFPLGIAYISSSLKKAGLNTFTLNLNHSGSNIEDCIKNNAIDVLLTGGLSVHYNEIKSIILKARSVNNSILTIIGGGIISSEPNSVLLGLGADIGVLGEGEITVVEVVNALEIQDELAKIRGIVYVNENNNIIKTLPRECINDINQLAYPDYDGFNFSEYLDLTGKSKETRYKRYVQMIASRSCPYNCTFCFHPIGNKYRQRSLENFFTEFEYMYSKFNFDYLSVCDELFAYDKNRLYEFTKIIQKYHILWDTQIRVDMFDDTVARALKESGCNYISFGLESASDKILASMKKNITVKQIENALQTARNNNIEIQGNFIFSDVSETYESATETLKWWFQNRQYNINLIQLSVFPGTPLFEYAIDKKIIEDKIKYLENRCPNVNISKMGFDDYTKVKKIINYLNSNYAIYPFYAEILEIDETGSSIKVEIICPNCFNTQVMDFHVYEFHQVACVKCCQRIDIDKSIFSTDNKYIEFYFESKIRQAKNNNKIVAIWGAGVECQTLLSNNEFLCGAVSFIFDKNKHGNTVFNYEILNPESFILYDIDVILICSMIRSSINQIRRQILDINHSVEILTYEEVISSI